MGVPRPADALGLLGLARRAGAVTPGVGATRRALQAGAVRLVLLATDASETQCRKVRGRARGAGVPVGVVASRAALGRALGRTELSVAGVTDRSFARQLQEKLPPAGGRRRGLAGYTGGTRSACVSTT